MPTYKKFSPETLNRFTTNGIFSQPGIQHHIRTQQFQEFPTKIDSIQRQSIDRNVRNVAETARFSDIYK